MFPPIPDWEGLHPLIVHFPIGLLLVAPLLVVVAMVSRRAQRPFQIAALLLMLLGTAAAYISIETGEAAAELAVRTAGVGEAIEQHEELAETTATIFTVLTAAFAVVVIVPSFLKKPLHRGVVVAAHVVFLLAYFAGASFISRTGHEGGRLVHELGVHSLVAGSPGDAAGEHDSD